MESSKLLMRFMSPIRVYPKYCIFHKNSWFCTVALPHTHQRISSAVEVEEWDGCGCGIPLFYRRTKRPCEAPKLDLSLWVGPSLTRLFHIGMDGLFGVEARINFIYFKTWTLIYSIKSQIICKNLIIKFLKSF